MSVSAKPCGDLKRKQLHYKNRLHSNFHESIFSPPMNVIAVRVDCKNEHGNVRHGTDVNELLNGIEDIPLVQKKAKSSLNGIASGINDKSNRKHLQ